MKNKTLINDSYKVFADFKKPIFFTRLDENDDDPESIDHDKNLAGTSRQQLSIHQIGTIGYSPITSFTPAAMGYFLPRLIELAVTNENDSDGDPFIVRFINLLLEGPDGSQFQLLNDTHKEKIIQALLHIKNHFEEVIASEGWITELYSAIDKWEQKEKRTDLT